jgi:hypothetical protein
MATEATRRIVAPRWRPRRNHGGDSSSGDHCRAHARRSQRDRLWPVSGRATPHAGYANADEHGDESAGGKSCVRTPRIRSRARHWRNSFVVSRYPGTRIPSCPDSKSNTPLGAGRDRREIALDEHLIAAYGVETMVRSGTGRGSSKTSRSATSSAGQTGFGMTARGIRQDRMAGRTSLRPFMGVVPVALVALVAGCGGSSPATTKTSPSVAGARAYLGRTSQGLPISFAVAGTSVDAIRFVWRATCADGKRHTNAILFRRAELRSGTFSASGTLNTGAASSVSGHVRGNAASGSFSRSGPTAFGTRCRATGVSWTAHSRG